MGSLQPVIFEFSGLDLQGTTLVAFETVSRNNTELAVHSDIDDEGQTVQVPKEKLHTTATNAEDGSKDFDALKSITINDKVDFTDLISGKEYTVYGVIMDKSTGKPLLVDGKEVQSSVTFVAAEGTVKALTSGTTLVNPEDAKTGKEETASEVNTDVTLVSGSVNVSFTLDGSSLAGKELVVFEDLKRGDITLAVHHDLNDKGQTVKVHKPNLKTTATANGKKDINVAQSVTITDKVAFNDLIVGKEYTIKGVLMDKSTGSALLVNDKEVTAEKTFTAKESDGYVNIDFTFDASNLNEDQEVVVFESLYRGGQEIGIHNDINDKDQTITFHRERLPQTGESTVNVALTVLGLVIVALAVLLVVVKIRKNV
ncbi:VaFE repeat-containing surface-anchored protein [Enterococcus nangangensis]